MHWTGKFNKLLRSSKMWNILSYATPVHLNTAQEGSALLILAVKKYEAKDETQELVGKNKNKTTTEQNELIFKLFTRLPKIQMRTSNS